MEETEESTFVCKRCGYGHEHQWGLVRHLNRKRRCKPLLSNALPKELLEELAEERNRNSICFCDKCGLGFKSRQGLYLHKRACKDDEQETAETVVEDRMNAFCESVETRLVALERAQQSLQRSNITQNIGHQTINNNINIIVPFGQENTEFITKLVDFLNRCCDRPEKGVTKIIKSIHFHPHRPENYNLTLGNGHIMTFDGEKWSIPPSKTKVLDDTIEKAVDIMDTHYVTKIERDPDPKFMLTKSSMIAFNRRMQRKDVQIIRGLRKDTEELIKEETEKVHTKYPGLPSTV